MSKRVNPAKCSGRWWGKQGVDASFFSPNHTRSNWQELNSAVETGAERANIDLMKLVFAFAVWIAMGVILGTGILLAVHGSPWLLIAAFIGFVIAVGKIGCLAH